MKRLVSLFAALGVAIALVGLKFTVATRTSELITPTCIGVDTCYGAGVSHFLRHPAKERWSR